MKLPDQRINQGKRIAKNMKIINYLYILKNLFYSDDI